MVILKSVVYFRKISDTVWCWFDCSENSYTRIFVIKFAKLRGETFISEKYSANFKKKLSPNFVKLSTGNLWGRTWKNSRITQNVLKYCMEVTYWFHSHCVRLSYWSRWAARQGGAAREERSVPSPLPGSPFHPSRSHTSTRHPPIQKLHKITQSPKSCIRLYKIWYHSSKNKLIYDYWVLFSRGTIT